MKRRILVVVVIVAASASAAATARMASGPVRPKCAFDRNSTAEEVGENRMRDFNASAAVFSGKVTRLEQVTVTFAVDSVWKGDVKRETTLLTGLTSDPNVAVEDVFEFSEGREYLVFAYRSNSGTLITSACARTALLEKARDEMRALEQIAPHKTFK